MNKRAPLVGNEWFIGAQPNPKDRRVIVVEDWGSQRIRDLLHREQDVAGVTDLVTGQDIILERIDCGLPGCECAVGIKEIVVR